MTSNHKRHRVVIIGGGFGGLYTAKALRHAPVDVTLIDKRNFHLFQPLLYQVATGGLSPGDICSPLRAVLNRTKNVTVLKAEAINVYPERRKVILRDGEVPYDSLIVATGASHHYFGNEHWAEHAPGIKSVEDALDMRRRIFLAFEAAERETDPTRRQAWLTFTVVGGGPTGVELAGALAELAHYTLREDFRHIDPSEAKIILIEGTDRVLPPYPTELSTKAQRSLEKLGVIIETGAFVTHIDEFGVNLKKGEQIERLETRTVLWGAGVQASPMGRVLAEAAGAELDRIGRVVVEPDMSLPTAPDIFVIGDLAHYVHQNGEPLPGVAPVAMQQGQFMADLIKNRSKGKPVKPFRYIDKGSLAVIGRNAAVAHVGPLKINGWLAWLIWVFIHIAYLIEFDNKMLVLFQWASNYFTRKRGARLITNDEPYVLVEKNSDAKASTDASLTVPV